MQSRTSIPITKSSDQSKNRSLLSACLRNSNPPLRTWFGRPSSRPQSDRWRMASASYELLYPASVQRTRDASLDLLEKSGRSRKDFQIAMELLVGDFDQGLEP